MRKTAEQKEIIKDYCRFPFFWTIQLESEWFLWIRNWITGDIRVCRKGD